MTDILNSPESMWQFPPTVSTPAHPAPTDEPSLFDSWEPPMQGIPMPTGAGEAEEDARDDELGGGGDPWLGYTVLDTAMTAAALPTTPSPIDPEDEAQQQLTALGLAPPVPPGAGIYALSPANLDLSEFLHSWVAESDSLGSPSDTGPLGDGPNAARVKQQVEARVMRVHYADLEGDGCDFQGIDWEDLGVTRSAARDLRRATYRNYCRKPGVDRWIPHPSNLQVPRTADFFRFQRMDIRRDVQLCHFQLRHTLAASSRSHVFYPTHNGGVQDLFTCTGETSIFMRLTEQPSAVASLAEGAGVLVAGGFHGEYMVRSLASEGDEGGSWHEGLVADATNAITNHTEVYLPRQSSAPVAAFASNDNAFRVLDLTTQRWLSRWKYSYALNCSAISTDGRLRLVVGDTSRIMVMPSDCGANDSPPRLVHHLLAHQDWVFGCAWADDGWTAATSAQDRTVKIWDARRWTDARGLASPVFTLPTNMASVRSLRFSPAGSGRRVLVAAEEADFVDVIDARTFAARQTLDLFGEIGGVDFANDGQDLVVLCCDPTRGGVLTFERSGLGAEFTAPPLAPRGGHDGRGWPLDEGAHDWPPSIFTEARRVPLQMTKRRRAAAMLDAMDFF